MFSMRCPRNTSRGCPFFSYMANRKKGSITRIMHRAAVVVPSAPLVKKKSADKRRRPEADHLPFGQPEQDLALYLA